MKRFAPLFVCLTLVAQVHAQDKAAVLRNMAAERQAMLKKNVAWYEKTLAEDYFEIGPAGNRIDKRQSLASTRNMFAALTITSLTTKLSSVQKVGEKTMATIDVRVLGTLRQKKGKPAPIEVNSSVIQVWSQIDGQWKIRSQKTMSQTMKVNGRRVG